MSPETSCRLWAAVTMTVVLLTVPLVCAGGLTLVEPWRFAAAAVVGLAGLTYCLAKQAAAYARVPPEERARWR